MKRLWLFALLFTVSMAGCSGSAPEGAGNGSGKGGEAATAKPKVAYVTNGVASFWVIAQKGAVAAGEQFGAEVIVRMPPNGVDDQKRMCQDLLAQKIDGIAISPIDPDNQGDLLEEIASRTNMITHDSDAPKSKRKVYIGVDNYGAGRMCGKLVKEAMPEGGSLMIFVGRLGQANARLRRQGVIDELLDRSEDASRYDDPNGGAIKGEKYTVLDTRTDDFDFGKAKAQAQDAIAKHPDIGCMVGLFAYNPPLILEAVKEADRVGKIKIVAFDEDDATLAGIAAGSIHGTTVQNPYQYGYKSVEVLAALARGDQTVIPANGFIDVPARNIGKETVAEFAVALKKLTSNTGDAPAAGQSANGK